MSQKNKTHNSGDKTANQFIILEIRKIFLVSFEVIISMLFGVVLLSLVYSINLNYTNDNYIKSVKQVTFEDLYYKLNKYNITKLDNSTDSVMILTAFYPGLSGESTVCRAMASERIRISGEDAYVTLSNYDNSNRDYGTGSYARYWHGYLIFLKPLFLFMDYHQIRLFNAFLYGVLLALLVILMYKKKCGILIIPFLISYFLISPMTIANTINFNSNWYITLISMIVYLLFMDKICANNIEFLYFGLIGILTSFFDLLTYPVVALGCLLVLAFFKDNSNFKDTFVKLCENVIAWFLGYILMWISKFVVGSVLTGKNIFEDAYKNVLFRIGNTSLDGQKYTYLSTIKRNLGALNRDFVVFIIIMTLFFNFVLLLYYFYKRKSGKNVSKEINITFLKDFLINNGLKFIVIALIPFVWYRGMVNHSYIHSFFTSRDLFISFFVFYTLMFKFWENIFVKNK